MLNPFFRKQQNQLEFLDLLYLPTSKNLYVNTKLRNIVHLDVHIFHVHQTGSFCFESLD